MVATTKIKGMVVVFIGLAFLGFSFFLTTRSSEAQELEGKISAGAQASQINLAGGMMAQMAYDTLEGKSTEMIPIQLFDLLRSARAFEHEQNFRLAMGLLAAETGMPMTEILPPPFSAIGAGGTQSSAGVSTGWGGFGEYGIWSILSFLYIGYLFGRNAFDLRPQGEELQEAAWTYQKAA